MNTKIFVWILVVLLLSSFVSATVYDDLNSNIKHLFTIDNINVSGNNAYNYSSTATLITKSNGAFGAVGKLAEAWDLTGNACSSTLGGTFYPATTSTINLWLKLDDSTPSSVEYIFSKEGTGTFWFYFESVVNGSLYYDLPSAGCDIYTTAFPSDGNYHMVTIISNTTKKSVYIDGVLSGSSTCSDVGISNAYPFTIGAYYFSECANYLNGFIDEWSYYVTELNQVQIDALYNSGYGISYPYGPGATTYLYITAQDSWNGTIISSFNANISWSNGTTTSHASSEGNIYLSNLTNGYTAYNITFWNATNYFNSVNTSVTLINATNNTLVGYLHQAELCLNATSKVSGNYIVANNFTINGVTRTSCFNISTATHNVQAQKTNWYSKNQSFTIAALSNTTRTIENMSSSLANITVYYSNGTKISSWNISITSNDYPAWPAENGSASSGSYNFSGINGTYTAIVNDAVGTETFAFTLNAYAQNISFYHFGIDNCTAYHVPTMNFTIWNEETAALLNNSALDIYLEITSSYYPGNKTYNFSFSTGNYYALCVPNNTIIGWTAYAQAEYSNLPNYAAKNYYLINYNLSNTSANIDLYLAYNTSQLKLQVRDYTDQGISNAYVKVLSYDLGTNSYKTTEIVKSDSSGDAYAEIIPNTQWYAFIVEYNGRIYLQTLPTKITLSTLTLRISLTSDYFTNYNIAAGISHLLFYNNATSTFSFTYDDPTGNVQQGCLQVTERNAFRDTVLNTTCMNSSASTILISIAGSAGNYTYIGSSYVMINGIQAQLNSTSVNLNFTYKMFGAMGWLITFLIVITLILVGCWHPTVAIVLAIFGIIVSVIMSFIYVTWTSIVVLVIVGIIAVVRTGNKPN
jgi:hypothetical protein